MRRRILSALLGGAILMVLGLVLGLIVGADIGGNYFTDFELGGLRGYEAVGNIGAWAGAVIGALLGAILGVKMSDKRGPKI